MNLRHLRDRKLVQWALAYLAGAWLLLQLLDLFTSTFSWPQLVSQLATVLLGIGFVAALVVAWYHGEKGAQRAGGMELLMLAALLVIAGTAVAFFARGRGQTVAGSGSGALPAAIGEAAEQGSIAVLPFVNMSGDPAQEFFSDGLTEELLNVLAQVPGLRVAARTSAFSFKGQNVKVDSIGRALRVAHVLEGSVRRSADQVRITAQLIDARSGYHLWSENYDRSYEDIFAIQDEISRAIVAELRLRMGGGQDHAAVPPTRTTDAEAHTLVLRAMAAERVMDDTTAVELYRAALARDPDYLDARAGLAGALGGLAYRGAVPREEGYRTARAEAERVLAVDPGHEDAHVALGHITDWHDWDFRVAERHYRKALERNPSNARAHRALAWLLMRLRQPEQALAEAQRAVQLDPLQAGSVNGLAVVYLFAGQNEQAIRTLNDALALVPESQGVLSNLTLAYTEAGRFEEAIRTGERLRTVTPPEEIGVLSSLGYAYARAGRRAEAEGVLREFENAQGVMWVDRALINLWLGNTELALEQLEKAIEAREDYVADLAIDPAYRPLHGKPRFDKLLAKVGLR